MSPKLLIKVIGPTIKASTSAEVIGRREELGIETTFSSIGAARQSCDAVLFNVIPNHLTKGETNDFN